MTKSVLTRQACLGCTPLKQDLQKGLREVLFWGSWKPRQAGQSVLEKLFSEGCSECGRKVGVPNVEFAKFLHEDKFLEQMTTCGPKIERLR
jgi:hypothetical protein